MQLIRTFLSVFVVAARRLWSTRWLALAGAIGLMVVVALTLSVPLYADAVYNRIFNQEIQQQGTSTPPFAFMFRYIGGWYGAVDWPAAQNVDTLMTTQVPGLLSLPRVTYVRYFKTDNLQFYAAKDAVYVGKRQPLAWTSIGFLSDFGDHVTMTEGKMPADTASPGDPIQVAVSKDLADELGLQVGEAYVAFDRVNDKIRMPVTISGVWQARDLKDPYWFYDPSYLKDVMVTTEANYIQDVSPVVPKPVYLGVWYMVFNGGDVHSGDVMNLLGRINFTTSRMNALLPNTKLDVSPVDALWKYQNSSSLLTIQLFAFSAPILLLVFAFITLVAGLAVNGQRNEIAVLRSRGASALQVIGISFLEACLLAVLAIAASVPVSQSVAQLVGQARSFLVFARGALLPVTMTSSTMQVGLVVALIAVIAMVFPIWEAARHTIITYKQERARSLKAPWWQRMWLDVLLLIPAAYGTYLLQKQGTIAISGVAQLSGSDPFNNPLLFMVPVLAMIGLTLFLIRLFPIFLRLLSWLLTRLSGTTLLLAARQLARSPGFYAAPMLLLVLTLALATFTSSLASTLDRSLVDQVQYRVGGDMAVQESGEDTAPASTAIGSAGTSSATSGQSTNTTTGPRFQFIPISDHLKVSGIQAAARVAHFTSVAQTNSGPVDGTFVGIDRVDYSRIAYWRADFGPGSLGAMMNDLATRDDGVLVPGSFLADTALKVGDPLKLTVTSPLGAVDVQTTIVGWFNLWPDWYPNKPSEGAEFIGNLEYLFQEIGSEVPYDVWLKVKAGSDPATIVDGIRNLGVNVVSYEDVRSAIEQEQLRPERQGLFGILSVGFAAAALLTVVGFFLYAVFSFRRRLIELGMLRAIGLSALQMAAYLGWELVLLLGTGAAAGTILGVWASRLYIPFLQVGATPEATVLPFLVVIAWPQIDEIYILFGGLFVVALIALLVFLMRMKIFQAVKLGETE